MRSDPPEPPEQAGDLGESFAHAFEGAWTEDVIDLSFGSPDSPAEVVAEPTAEEAVESTVPPPPLRIVEALLFVGGAPLTPERALRIVRGLSHEQFTEAIDTLNRDYRRQNRPYVILPQGHGFALALRPKFLPLHEKLFGSVREARLSTAAVDVLALVAYRQPTTKSEIDSMRGLESGTMLRQLVRRGLIQVLYRGEAEQTAVMYGTTPRFLEMFGLQSLDDLPKTQDLDPS